MIRCILREAWKEFKDSKFFEELVVGCMLFIIVFAIGGGIYGLWKLLVLLLGEQTMTLSFCGLVFLGLFIGAVKLLWRGIVALKRIVNDCRVRE